jgi:V/A-type H+-transporting ATPase subunit K
MIVPILFFAAAVAIPFAYYRWKKRARHAVYLNLVLYVLAVIAGGAFVFATGVQAAEGGTPPGETAQAAAFLAAALVTGMGAIGTGIAVSHTAAAAIGAISENEASFGKAMIFVAMAEGIAIYGLLIAFMILGRV